MIVKQSFFRNKFRSLVLHIFCYLENSGNADFLTNGESFFLDSLFDHFGKNCHDHNKVILFDIGANIGKYTERLLDKSMHLNNKVKIHLFEPTQACFDILQKKFAHFDEVVLNKKAVSNKFETVEIFYDEQKSGLASLYKRNLNAYSIQMNQSESVATIRLDSYINDMKIKHIHLLKVDIEGHEMKALEGGAYLNGDFIDFLQLEYGGANLDSHTNLMDIYDFLEKAGFVLAKVMPNGLDIRPYKPWMDNFQYANYVAVSAKIIGRLT